MCPMLLTEYLSRPGEVVKLAREIAVAPAVVSQWKNGTRNVPADRCPAVERATDGAVRCEEMRPDVDWAYLRGTVAVDAAEPAKTEAPKEAA